MGLEAGKKTRAEDLERQLVRISASNVKTESIRLVIRKAWAADKPSDTDSVEVGKDLEMS